MSKEDDKIEELKEVIRLANETLRDLRQERKNAEVLAKEYIAKFEKTVGEELVKQLNELGEATQKAMGDSVARVFKKFDELAALLMGESKGELSIPELIKYRQSLKEY